MSHCQLDLLIQPLHLGLDVEVKDGCSVDLIVPREPEFILDSTLVVGIQGPKGDPGDASASYTHIQGSPDSVWIIEHNLGFWPNVYVLDTNGDECEGDVVNYPSMTRTDIIFSAPFAGRARLT